MFHQTNANLVCVLYPFVNTYQLLEIYFERAAIKCILNGISRNLKVFLNEFKPIDLILITHQVQSQNIKSSPLSDRSKSR